MSTVLRYSPRSCPTTRRRTAIAAHRCGSSAHRLALLEDHHPTVDPHPLDGQRFVDPLRLVHEERAGGGVVDQALDQANHAVVVAGHPLGGALPALARD